MIRVLVVDDSALVRKLFGRVLAEEPDFQVQFARDGHEALAMLEQFRPDVITLDVQMPGMDGLACLDRIMVQRPSPVVMVSSITSDGAEATLSALQLGAVDFVTKPSGAVSLHIDAFAPLLKSRIRQAAAARVPVSRRLRERVRMHTRGLAPVKRRRRPVSAAAAAHAAPVPVTVESSAAQPAVAAASGDGVVLVGTSTGGPPALEEMLTALPAEFPWPIVVAQHMPATFTGPLARRLDSICALRVVEVDAALPLEAGTVYIGRGNGDVVLARRGGVLVVMPVPEQAGYPWHPSTDRLVRSALALLPATQLVGVLMTGMGDDGAAAMTELRAQGGQTIAESEETAVIWGMPGELARAGGASFVLPLPRIAPRLRSLVPAHAAHP